MFATYNIFRGQNRILFRGNKYFEPPPFFFFFFLIPRHYHTAADQSFGVKIFRQNFFQRIFFFRRKIFFGRPSDGRPSDGRTAVGRTDGRRRRRQRRTFFTPHLFRVRDGPFFLPRGVLEVLDYREGGRSPPSENGGVWGRSPRVKIKKA